MREKVPAGVSMGAQATPILRWYVCMNLVNVESCSKPIWRGWLHEVLLYIACLKLEKHDSNLYNINT